MEVRGRKKEEGDSKGRTERIPTFDQKKQGLGTREEKTTTLKQVLSAGRKAGGMKYASRSCTRTLLGKKAIEGKDKKRAKRIGMGRRVIVPHMGQREPRRTGKLSSPDKESKELL